ncbi:MAG: hypothetical protein Q8P67_10400, partial [archaeon]|nr:hypothetical protein [archaeon]
MIGSWANQRNKTGKPKKQKMIAIKKKENKEKHDWRNLERLEKSLRKASLFLYINPFGEVIDLADLLNPKSSKAPFFLLFAFL